MTRPVIFSDKSILDILDDSHRSLSELVDRYNTSNPTPISKYQLRRRLKDMVYSGQIHGHCKSGNMWLFWRRKSNGDRYDR